jgi:hypothetical protein
MLCHGFYHDRMQRRLLDIDTFERERGCAQLKFSTVCGRRNRRTDSRYRDDSNGGLAFDSSASDKFR